MGASVNVKDLGSEVLEFHMTASQVELNHQDLSASSTMANDSEMPVNLEVSLVEEVEQVSLAQVELLKIQVENLKRNLHNVENKLGEENALRVKAECALEEYNVREKSLLTLERDGRVLKEEVKWRNEQFESLQEAHNRMRDQFHESQNIWALEKAAMLRNIEGLTENATELERLQAVVHDVRECNTKAERRILLLEDRLRDAQRELEAKNNLSRSFLTVQEHEEVVLAMRSECEVLQRQLSTCDAERYELEMHRDKLLAESREKKQLNKRDKEELISNEEVVGRKDRSSMPAAQRINTRRQLEDSAKLVKSLNTELQKWKDMATESSEGSSRLQASLQSVRKENDELRVQLNEWKQKASDHKGSIEDLEADVQKWKNELDSAIAENNAENQLRMEELEHLRAEVEKRKTVASTAEGEGEPARMKPLDSLGMLIGSNSTEECGSERSLRERELELEVEDWKVRVVCAEKEQEDMRQHYDMMVKELHLELEKKLKDFEVKSRDAADHVAEERQRRALELVELQAELQNWKTRAADAVEECASLRNANENVTKELQLCKENAEAATEKSKSVRANLEKEVQDLENQVHVWKQNTEKALEGIAKSHEYEDLIKTLDQERISVQLQLERALLEMEEKAAAFASEMQALKNEFDSDIEDSSAEILQLRSVVTGLKSEISELKVKNNDNHSPQLLQLQSLLTKTQSQLQEWQVKATVASQAEDELRHAVDEIRSQTEKLQNFIRTLEGELLEWKEKAEHFEMLQLQLTSSLALSQKELQSWKQKAMDAAMASELELRNSVSDLETELSQWKVKVQEGELLQQQMRISLTETQMELRDMKEKIGAFSSSADSLKGELSSANELACTLASQLSIQKQNVSSIQKLNRHLETDLLLVREEALSRKEWMTQILTQLEGTVSMSQKELQSKLHLAQHRILGIESVNSRFGEEAVAKGLPVGSYSTHDVVNCKSSPETAALFSSHHQRSKSVSPYFKSDIFRESVMNPAADKLRQELSSLNSFVSKLEHVRSSNYEKTQAPSVVDGEVKMDNEVLDMERIGAGLRRDVLLQKQAESSRTSKEFLQPQRTRIDSPNRSQAQSGTRFKVLAEVDGNSLLAPAKHEKLQSEGPCPPVALDNIPFSRLRCTASGV